MTLAALLEVCSAVYNPYTYHFSAIGKDCTGYTDNQAALLAVAKHDAECCWQPLAAPRFAKFRTLWA